MMPSDPFFSLQLEGQLSDLLALEALWEEQAVSTSLFEVSEKNALWSLEALFTQEPDIKTLFAGASDDLSAYQDKVTLTYLPATDWLAQNRLSFAPLSIGRFYIHGGDEGQSEVEEKNCLEVAASTAFGTGRHETTKGCILQLEALAAQEHAIHDILDLGCGTGILAMAAAHLFEDARLVASDNDPQATDMTIHNLTKNHLAKRIDVRLSEGFDAMDEDRFDLVIANILAGPLVELAPMMTHHTRQGAHVILSGILETQATQVVGAYEAQGFRLVTHHTDGDWCALTLKK
ncbi:MAG: tRNA (adenine(22)-N(1))-methyltransferase TrmK [Proteobacteria bacterium]|nr:tRNA (adenine(22)-N(1))-methyltransferase TrmK [Pseudomonadota bacterium]